MAHRSSLEITILDAAVVLEFGFKFQFAIFVSTISAIAEAMNKIHVLFNFSELIVHFEDTVNLSVHIWNLAAEIPLFVPNF